MRKVIFHYHLFKNAGTSLDAILRENFPNQWASQEFTVDLIKHRSLIEAWIRQTPQAVCFSSHTAMLPPPDLTDIKVLPVLFYRHPIDRIVSAYRFEQRQKVDTFGSVLARHTNMAGYIATRLALSEDRQCRNFHVHRLAQMFDARQGNELSRAKRAVDELPFIGVVEDFAGSLERLQRWWHLEGFDGIALRPVKKNVSQDIKKSLELRLEELRYQLGDVIYTQLLEANQADMELYAEVCCIHEEKLSG